MDSESVGTLVLTPGNVCAFQYHADYLRKGVSISPFHLPLTSSLYLAESTPFRGNFGVFDDSLPDGWGNLVLDRYLRSKQVDPNALSVMQRLCFVGESGRGALCYLPDHSPDITNAGFDFEEFRREAEQLFASSDYIGENMEALYCYGGSSGGARPKAFVTIDGREWMVKFPNSADPKDVGKIEYEYSLLAKACGIEMAETKLFEDRYFGVARFDRAGDKRIHTVSAAGILHADYRMPSIDYTSLLLACNQLSRNLKETEKLFRLMVFNVVISNRDDHAKNFSFQLMDGNWRCAPAYDLLPSYGFGGWHTTTINGSGDPKMNDILAVAKTAGISENIARSIVHEVRMECRNAKKEKIILEQEE
jgi:serine/threonine-protein kinase HipA